MENKIVKKGKVKNYIKDSKNRILLVLALVMILVLTPTIPQVTQGAQPIVKGDMFVSFIDVGQADSILVQLPNKETMLIDAGDNSDSQTIINYLKSKNIGKIDYLIATHPHEDHIGSMDDIIRTFKIGKIYMPKITTTTKTFEDLLLAIKASNLKVNTSKSNVELFNSVGNLSAVIVAPIKDKYDQINDYGTVIKLTYGDTSFLLASDAEKISEEEILTSGVNIKADVLKIGHHGSNTSTSDKFLSAVNPKYAVISVGKDNPYGHPKQSVLDKLISSKITLFRTDIQGTITFKSDAKNLTVTTSKDSTVSASKEIPVPKPISPSKPPLPSPSKPPSPSPSLSPSLSPLPDSITETKNMTVYITKTGTKYHLDSCSSLRKSKIAIDLKDAREKYDPCKICNPPK